MSIACTSYLYRSKFEFLYLQPSSAIDHRDPFDLRDLDRLKLEKAEKEMEKETEERELQQLNAQLR